MDSMKELYSIREWAPLNINEQIPSRVQRGFFFIDVKLSSIDVIEDYMAIGSDVGTVFWYNRKTGEMQKLKAEISSRITCVKIVDSVEYMVAAGSACGQVSVFQIQKPLPPDLNLVAPCARSKPINRYTIRDLHRTPVTCCEWSKNGMKLYSGDRQGIVVLTEFDYQAHLSKSKEILCEDYEIVQLSLYQCYLLVSTLYRSIVCQRNNLNDQWHITQIGKKDRNELVDCGGIFLKASLKKSPKLITGCPGLKFWLANIDGNVEKTFQFREAVTYSPTHEIPILNPKITTMNSSRNLETKDGERGALNEGREFHKFYLYDSQDSLLVTHDEMALYILNLDKLRVEALARGFRKILDFCVCGKEIFVLEGERSLLRLAPLPEKPNKTSTIIFNPLLPPPTPFLSGAAPGFFESPVEYEPEEQMVINAEECFELPPIETLNLDIPIHLAVESPRAEQNRRLQIFNEISQMDFDQSILHRSGLLINGRKKRKSKSSERCSSNRQVKGIVEIGHVVKTNEDESSDETGKSNLQKPQNISDVKIEKENETISNVIDNKNKDSAINTPLTSIPILMDASFCSTIENIERKPSEIEEKLCLEDVIKSLPPLSLSPSTSMGEVKSIKSPLKESGSTLTTELNVGLCDTTEKLDIKISTNEIKEKQHPKNLEKSPSIQPPLSFSLSTSKEEVKSTKSPLKLSPTTLSLTYPKPLLEDAEVQTTPRKKIYYLQQDTVRDYSSGEPVDDFYSALRATTMIEDIDTSDLRPQGREEEKQQHQEKESSTQQHPQQQLRFVASQPLKVEEVGSFLPDFSRIRDPLVRKSPPQSGDSGTSSEWEFLDN